MMRNRLLSSLRSYLLPAFAAMILVAGPVACSSTGEGELTPTLDGAASGEEAKPGNVANANAAASGENAIANANAEAANTAKPDGAATANNPVGTELNNAIAGDGGGANAAAETPAANTAAPANAATNTVEATPQNANAAPPSDPAPAASAPADANLSNPFSAAGAAPSNLSASPNAQPMNSEAAPAPEQLSTSGSTTAPATATASPDSGSANASVTVSGPSSLPEMGSKMAYYVMRGDTLAAIALKIYGSRAKWKSLQVENGLADANRIYPGDVIYYTLSEGSKGFAEKYELASRQSYTVSKGDSLALLAAKFYGTQGAWRALWKENPHILNPDRIRVGMTLTYRATEKVALKDEDEVDEVEGGDVESLSELFTAATE